MIAPTPAPMTVYDGRLALGEIEDHGRGCVMAFKLAPTGRVAIGTFPDRRLAMRAISAPMPTPPEAA